MTLAIEPESRTGIHILHARGRLTLGDGTMALRDTIRRLVEGQSVRIVLDLGEVASVDSAGIGELVSAYTSITSHGGRLALVALQKRVADLLQITKLLTVFEVFDTVDKAVTALGTPPA